MQLKAIVAPKRTADRASTANMLQVTDTRFAKALMSASVSARLLKYLLTCLPIRPNHSFKLTSLTSVNDVYWVTSRCPYKLCSRVFQSRVFSRPLCTCDCGCCCTVWRRDELSRQLPVPRASECDQTGHVSAGDPGHRLRSAVHQEL